MFGCNLSSYRGLITDHSIIWNINHLLLSWGMQSTFLCRCFVFFLFFLVGELQTGYIILKYTVLITRDFV